MNTTGISSATPNQPAQPFWQQRSDDLLQLAQAVTSGDLNKAREAYNAIVQIGKVDPYANGVPFRMANREQDFQAVGNALQAGDLAGAKQALLALRQTYLQPEPSPVQSGTSSAGPAAVLNLSGGK